MTYINTTTGQYPVSEQEIRNSYPNTSFPSPFVPPDNYQVVFPASQPTFNTITQTVRETTPILTDKGHYEQAWEVVNLEPEQVASNQEVADAQHNASIKAQIAAIEAGQARAVREAALGDPTYLQQIEAQIQALREQLK